MGELDRQKRARLPKSAFAYVDSKGRRRLPLTDGSHVRNALSRFNQTRFEDDAARDLARKRVLAAAKRYGIVPVGFFAGQLRQQSQQAVAGRLAAGLVDVDGPAGLEERLRDVLHDPTLAALPWSPVAGRYVDADGRAVELPPAGAGRAVTFVETRGRPLVALVHAPATLADPKMVAAITATIVPAMENERLRGAVADESRQARSLPGGPVTFLMTDIEDSTGLLDRLADAYPALLAEVRGVLRSAVRRAGGREIDARADEYFAVFEQPPAAIHAALAIERRLRRRTWPDGGQLRLRYGLHHGRPMITDSGYVGVAVNATARVCAAGHGGQILISRAAYDVIKGSEPRRVRFRPLGAFQLRGLRRPDTLYQVLAPGLERDFPPLRAAIAVETD
ncbi:MAG: adenylate/guanylate cyclase domain-containing protein [Candidatus Limnocylindrales bacterium]